MLNQADEWKYRNQRPKISLLEGEEGYERVLTHDEEQAYLAPAPELLRDFVTIGLDAATSGFPAGRAALGERSLHCRR